MMQHALYHLVNEAYKRKTSKIEEGDVTRVIKTLYMENDSFSLLKENIGSDEKLKKLVLNILAGKSPKYLPYIEYSMMGAGVIIEKNGLCEIRNAVYKSYLREILTDDAAVNSPAKPKKWFTKIKKLIKNISLLVWEFIAALGVLLAAVPFLWESFFDKKPSGKLFTIIVGIVALIIAIIGIWKNKKTAPPKAGEEIE